MDLDAVRTFVAAADAGRFQDAATDLAVTQQAVSKRIAALEKTLGARLFTRTARGARLTGDGEAFLPHARELLLAEARAMASVRSGRRALRVDVIGRRLGTATLLRGFHRAHPDVALEVATLFDADAAVAAVRDGSIDASFRAVAVRQLPDGVEASWVLDEPLQLLTGPAHPLADATALRPEQLTGHRIWMPGLVPGTEWAAYYAELATAFGLSIDAVGPNFGTEVLLETIADAPDVATLVGAEIRLSWPAGLDLRRVPLENPTPVYPHSLIWRGDNAHPALARLRAHLRPGARAATTWRPSWAS